MQFGSTALPVTGFWSAVGTATLPLPSTVLPADRYCSILLGLTDHCVTLLSSLTHSTAQQAQHSARSLASLNGLGSTINLRSHPHLSESEGSKFLRVLAFVGSLGCLFAVGSCRIAWPLRACLDTCSWFQVAGGSSGRRKNNTDKKITFPPTENIANQQGSYETRPPGDYYNVYNTSEYPHPEEASSPLPDRGKILIRFHFECNEALRLAYCSSSSSFCLLACCIIRRPSLQSFVAPLFPKEHHSDSE